MTILPKVHRNYSLFLQGRHIFSDVVSDSWRLILLGLSKLKVDVVPLNQPFLHCNYYSMLICGSLWRSTRKFTGFLPNDAILTELKLESGGQTLVFWSILIWTRWLHSILTTSNQFQDKNGWISHLTGGFTGVLCLPRNLSNEFFIPLETRDLGKFLPMKMVLNADFFDWKFHKCTFLIHFEMLRFPVPCMMCLKCCQNCLASVWNRDKIFWDSATQISMTTDWLCWQNEGNRVCWCWYCMCDAILLVGSMY